MSPTNFYFNNYDDVAEQRLMDDLINEVVQQYGIDCKYMPRTSQSNVDIILGDDPTKKFTEVYPVEVYIQSVDNFEGGELFSKFGLEVRKQARFLITQRSFARALPIDYKRPREGDLIWMPNFKALFEIKYVDEETFFYEFGRLYGYSMICEKFRYNNELIDTSITEIDTTADTIVTVYDYIMSAAGSSGVYQLGEKVYQGLDLASANATATLVNWDRPTLTLSLKHIDGTFINNIAIKGANSAASFVLSSVDLLNNTNEIIDDNSRLNTEKTDVLNFDESNPFGNP